MLWLLELFFIRLCVGLCGFVRFVEGLELFLFWNFGLMVVIGVLEVDKFGKVSEEGVLKNSSRLNRRNILIDGDEKVIFNFGNFL